MCLYVGYVNEETYVRTRVANISGSYPLTAGPVRYYATRNYRVTYVTFVAGRICSLSTVVCVDDVDDDDVVAAAAAAGVGAWTAIPFLSDDDAAPHDVPQRRYPCLTFVPRRRRRQRQRRRRTSHPHRHTE